MNSKTKESIGLGVFLLVLTAGLCWGLWAWETHKIDKERQAAKERYDFWHPSAEVVADYEKKHSEYERKHPVKKLDAYSQSIVDRNKAYKEIQKADKRLGVTNGLDKIFVP